jgi:Mrp family chromosome partitioning ATPase
MAKIRDLLKLADSRHDDRHATLPLPRAFTPAISPEPDDELSSPEETPFIEVGGKNEPLQASAGVLSVPVNRSVPESSSSGRPASAQERLDPPSSLKKAITQRASFTFLPLPAEPPPLQPPTRRFVPELVAFHQPEDPLSQQYRQLLAAIEAQLPSGQTHVILFAGFTPEADTTTALLNLAISRARRDSGDAIIVDADLRNPCVHDRLGLFAEPGLRDVLTSSVSLQRAIQETGQPNLYALTAGLGRAGDPGLLAGQAIRSILRHLRERFNITLIDAPHWDGRADLVSLAGVCDAVYLVLPESQVDTPNVQQLTQVITLEGVSLRGYVLLPV